MHCLVTGCAGFIGSHLTEALLASDHSVRGIDSISDYYPQTIKEANLMALTRHQGFEFHRQDILSCDIKALLENIEVIFHLAAQPGVRASWGKSFGIYVDANIRATQILLEAAINKKPSPRFVYASSSSVYGDTDRIPMRESDPTRPRSPYGVTKLAAENLCGLYTANFGLHTVSLRYFTVFGPRQRPDMAIHRFLLSTLNGSQVPLYGDGSQMRDFTYVADIVDGTIRAATGGSPGGIYNLGGGNKLSVNELIRAISLIGGRRPEIVEKKLQVGDVRVTLAHTNAAFNDLGWTPKHSMEDGLKAELEWLRNCIDKKIIK